MKLKIATLLASVLLAISVKAQSIATISKSHIGVDIGYSFEHLNDQNFSPLNQKGGGLFYAIFYENRQNNILKLNISYSDGQLASGTTTLFETTYYASTIGVSYFKNVSTSTATTKFYIGGAYNLDVYYMDWLNQDAFSYNTTNGLAIAAAFTTQLTDKQFIESSIEIPFLQFLSRPPYNGINETIIENQDTPVKIIFDGDLTSFKKYKAITWNINYNLEIYNHINWRLNYTLSIKKVNELHAFTSVSNRISTSMSYQF